VVEYQTDQVVAAPAAAVGVWGVFVAPRARWPVSSPVRVANDVTRGPSILELVPSVPMLVWGRDDLRTGDMWNSNSLISWLLARGGVEVSTLQPPAGGRAPGWHAGLELARRQIEMPIRSG